MLNVDSTFPKLNKLRIRLLSSVTLASLGIIFGLAPEVSVRSSNSNLVSVSLASSALGQEVTLEETQSYAKAGYEVELLRREVYQELKNSIDEPPQNIVCDQQSTIDNLQPEAQEIASRYCSESQQIVQQNNLSINRFNELKAQYDSKGEFYEQVQGILRQLQN